MEGGPPIGIIHDQPYKCVLNDLTSANSSSAFVVWTNPKWGQLLLLNLFISNDAVGYIHCLKLCKMDDKGW